MTRTIRHAVRHLLQRPGGSALIVLILALGIGVNAAMFGLTDLVLFRPVPVAEPDRVVRVFTREPESGEISNGSAPWGRELAEVPAFDGVAAYTDWVGLAVASRSGNPEPVSAGLASGGFFDVLGVSAALGRVFGDEVDAGRGQHPVAVISDAWWRTRFDADPAVLGRDLVIGGHAYQVIGVLPPGFNGPALGSRVDLWLPLSMTGLAMAGRMDESVLDNRGTSWLDVVARLAEGQGLASAQQAVDAWAAGVLERLPPDQVGQGRGPHARLVPMREAAVDPYGTEDQSRRAWLLVAVSLLVLLVAAANAAGLLAVRGDERRRELAVRVSLGAGPSALVTQLLVEALVLVALGAALGVVLGLSLARAVLAADPSGLALPADAMSAVLQPRALALTAVAALFALLLGSLGPVRRALRVDVVDGLRAGGIQGTADAGRQRGRLLLVGSQLALSLALLVCAALLLRSLWLTGRVDPGFSVDGRMVASVSLARPGLSEEQVAATFARIEQRVSALPGVTGAAWMATVPVQNGGMRRTLETGVPGAPTGSEAQADFNVVSPGAFEVLGIPLLRGRSFDEGDAGRAVVVVNRSFAERYLPGREALGQRIPGLGDDEAGAEVIGVVGDVRQRSLRAEPPAQAYVMRGLMPVARLGLVVHAEVDPAATMGAMLRVIREVDPEALVTRVRSLEDHVAVTLGQARLFAGLLAGFAGLAVVLAGSGLYGSLSAWLRSRTRELGIRVALGADASRVVRLVAGQGARLLAWALPAGALLALGGGRLLSGLLYGVAGVDAWSWLAAVTLLALTALLALAVPLRRALEMRPTEALRQD